MKKKQSFISVNWSKLLLILIPGFLFIAGVYFSKSQVKYKNVFDEMTSLSEPLKWDPSRKSYGLYGGKHLYYDEDYFSYRITDLIDSKYKERIDYLAKYPQLTINYHSPIIEGVCKFNISYNYVQNNSLDLYYTVVPLNDAGDFDISNYEYCNSIVNFTQEEITEKARTVLQDIILLNWFENNRSQFSMENLGNYEISDFGNIIYWNK